MSTLFVGDVIAASRLPHRFYSLIHNHSGRDVHYQNPGVSVLSYIHAHGMLNETVTLEGQLHESYLECDHFSRDAKILLTIFDTLQNDAKGLAIQIGQLQGRTKVNFLRYVQDLQELMNVAAKAYDLAKPNLETFSYTNLEFVACRDALCKLQDKVAEIAAKLDSITPDPQVA